MLDKLNKENYELKKQVDHMRRVFKSKCDELRIMLGVDADLEAILKAKPNSREMNVLKLYKEAKERAETLGKINRDLEKKMSNLQNEVDNIRKEKHHLELKYNQQFIAMEDKVNKFKNGID
jgi:uncharacterized protein YlxW (UPF0749 family)